MTAGNAASAFLVRINRTDLPSEDEAAATLCASIWPSARAALEQADLGDDPGAQAVFMQGLCRWRTHFSRLLQGADARAAVFVITCAARLVLMDTINGEQQRISALAAALGEWKSGARAAELAGLLQFRRPAAAADWRERAVRVLGHWFTSTLDAEWPSCWAECTTLLLLREGQTQLVDADEGFLRAAAEWDADCCLRMYAASQLRTLSQEPLRLVGDDELKTARDWLISKV
jgi:hypothetical protein